MAILRAWRRVRDLRRLVLRRVVAARRRLALVSLVAVGFTLLAWVLYAGPRWYLERRPDFAVLEAKERLDAEDQARRTLAQILGGFVVLLGAYFTWRRVTVIEEGQITDRYAKAVELLSDETLDARLGGIYALERVARDSKKDHWTIMEVLTAYVREHATWKGEVEAPKKPVPPENSSQLKPFIVYVRIRLDSSQNFYQVNECTGPANFQA